MVKGRRCDVADLADIGLEWNIKQARDGQREPLAKSIKRWEGPMPPKLLNFLAGVISGDIKLKRPKKTTRPLRNIRERNVVFVVNTMMAKMGKKRDAALRTRLTLEACEHFRTTPVLVAAYLKHPPAAKRRPTRKNTGLSP